MSRAGWASYALKVLQRLLWQSLGQQDSRNIVSCVIAQRILRHVGSHPIRQRFIEAIGDIKMPRRICLTSKIVGIQTRHHLPFFKRMRGRLQLCLPCIQIQTLPIRQARAQRHCLTQPGQRFGTFRECRMGASDAEICQRELRIKADGLAVHLQRRSPLTLPRSAQTQCIGSQRLQVGRGHDRQWIRTGSDGIGGFTKCGPQLRRKAIHRRQHRSNSLSIHGFGANGGLRVGINDLDTDAHHSAHFRNRRKQHQSRTVTQCHLRCERPAHKLFFGISTGPRDRRARDHVAEHIDVARLLQTDAECLCQGIVEQ
ncbi:hypothetical protein D3C81_1217930 [compost metagenome]